MQGRGNPTRLTAISSAKRMQPSSGQNMLVGVFVTGSNAASFHSSGPLLLTVGSLLVSPWPLRRLLLRMEPLFGPFPGMIPSSAKTGSVANAEAVPWPLTTDTCWLAAPQIMAGASPSKPKYEIGHDGGEHCGNPALVAGPDHQHAGCSGDDVVATCRDDAGRVKHLGPWNFGRDLLYGRLDNGRACQRPATRPRRRPWTP